METDTLLPLSALQHFVFCRRQAALIHIDRIWTDNRLTAEGNLLHTRADAGGHTRRAKILEWRGVDLVCRRLGLIGKADVIEIHDADTAKQRLVPVEYKRGKTKAHDADRIQLAAQALCLEEMLGTPVLEGVLFYGTPNRRERVVINEDLRAATEAAATACRTMIDAGVRPPSEPGAKCKNCSLLQTCAPNRNKAVAAWFARQRALLEQDP